MDGKLFSLIILEDFCFYLTCEERQQMWEERGGLHATMIPVRGRPQFNYERLTVSTS